MSIMRHVAIVAALALAPAGAGLTMSCGSSSAKGAEEPAASGDPVSPDNEPECCCQRYDDKGNPTSAAVLDAMACKSSGGSCTADESACSEE